jgi:hypothetical protein
MPGFVQVLPPNASETSNGVQRMTVPFASVIVKRSATA